VLDEVPHTRVSDARALVDSENRMGLDTHEEPRFYER
jgi:hypothetical protein